MEHPEGVSHWGDELASALPVLLVAQRRVLAQECFAWSERAVRHVQARDVSRAGAGLRLGVGAAAPA